MRHVSRVGNELPAILRADANRRYNNCAGRSIDDLRAARVNLAAFIDNEGQCDRNSDRENLGDLQWA